MSALFDPKRENLRQLGRQIAKAYPVSHDTPVDMLKMLEKLQ